MRALGSFLSLLICGLGGCVNNLTTEHAGKSAISANHDLAILVSGSAGRCEFVAHGTAMGESALSNWLSQHAGKNRSATVLSGQATAYQCIGKAIYEAQRAGFSDVSLEFSD